MDPPDRATADDELMPLLLAYQEALARGTSPPNPRDYLTRPGPELLARWDRARAALDLLALVRPSGQPEKPLAPGMGPETDPHPLPGAAPEPYVPGYEILGELGRGGMGVVYKANDVALQRVVALKMILAGDFAEPAHRERFRREAQAVARLHHPHVVQVFHIGEHRSQPFIALEFCPGGSLDGKLTGAPRPAAEAAQLVEVLAGAVHHAHQRGIVHRDLKPANVLFGADGAPKVADFGLARRLTEEKRDATPSGSIVGTVEYMAPEQAAGKKDVGPAADVYSLGAILYEMLTGRPPFRAQTRLDTLMQVIAAEPLPPSRLGAKVPRDLETICLKCLEKEPHQRYASALALADDLRAFREGRPIIARRASLWERAWKGTRRRPARAASLTAAVLFLAAGLWYWNAYLRTQIDYYTAATRRWGVMHGVGPLAESDVRRRNTSLKVYRKGGRVLKVETVNGRGQPAPAPGTGTMIEGIGPREAPRRECSWEYVYSQEGDLVKEVARDRSGRLVYGLHYTTRTTAHYTDDKGYVRPGEHSDAAYVEFVYGPDGLEREHRYQDSRGRRAPDRNGTYGRRFDHDERGLKVEETFLDAAGNPTGGRDGPATVRSRYDREGNLVEQGWFGPDGRPDLGPSGTHKVKFHYDEQGNRAEHAYFDADDRPARNEDGVHKVVSRHDDHGNLVGRSFFGTDGRPALHQAGNAGFTARYDERGNVVEQAYFGAEGEPVLLRRDKVHRATSRYDERGHPVEVAYFGTDDRPTQHRDGYARLGLRYDERGNRIEERYLDAAGNPTLTRQHLHRAVFGYDERGNRAEVAFYGTDDRPILNDEGVHKALSRYDDRGNLLEEVYFGTDGKPTRHKEGYARVAWTWDEPGLREIDVAYFDESDRPLAVEVVVQQVVPGTQAALAGVCRGDVLRSYDGETVRNKEMFAAAVARRSGTGRPGPVRLEVRRGESTLPFSLAPGPLGVALKDRVSPR